MIHQLEVDPSLSPAQTRKVARRLAMTGGYEVVLPNGVTPEQLEHLVEQYLPELVRYQQGSSAYRSSLAYRILALVLEHEALSGEARRRVEAKVD